MDADPPEPLRIAPDAAVVVVTGAGISAESGIPTFRDPDGIWRKYDLERVATPQGFANDPDLVWRFYSERRVQVLQCEPNAAHHALVALERYLASRGRFTLITQNVDGLHQRAGSRAVIPIHGNLLWTRCSNPGCASEPFEDRNAYLDGCPRCATCGDRLRPDVIWFGEYLDPVLERDARLAIADCDLFVAIGTSGVVYPVAGYVEIAANLGVPRVLVNLEPPANVGLFTAFYQGRAAEVLPVLLQDALAGVPRSG